MVKSLDYDHEYELYYWTGIQGRGEFIRLAFEEARCPYLDVARVKGDEVILKALEGRVRNTRPFAPPFLKVSRYLIAQTANILQFVGPRIGLAPRDELERLAIHQHQLTIADLVTEVHDTHHPIGSSLYYEDQKVEARRRAEIFLRERMPKFLTYFEAILGKRRWLVGREQSYVDLSLFQIVAGLTYAFPGAFGKFGRKIPNLLKLAERVQKLPGIAAYLASERRIPFNEQGIFRHYPELDVA